MVGVGEGDGSVDCFYKSTRIAFELELKVDERQRR